MKHLLFTSLAVLLVFKVSAQENLIENGDFSNNLSNWNLREDGSTASIEVREERAFIEIEQPGNEVTDPQLIQEGITLTQNEAYVVKFFASGTDSPTVVEVQVRGSDGAVYSNPQLGRFELNNRSRTFSLPFFMEEATDENAQLQFNFGNVEPGATVLLDSVALVTNPDQMIYVYTPDAGTEWITGNERKIEWSNSGDIPDVKIQFSNNNGADWTTIVAAASNEREFTWLIPADAAGDNCLIIVSSTDGDVSDTTDAFLIYEAGSVQAGEKVENGQFIGSANEWKLDVSSGHARGMVVEGEYRIDSIGGLENPQSWMVKLYQSGISLESGKMYTFSFDAYASQPRIVYANVGPDGSPYTVYGGDTVAINLTTEKQTFTTSFITEQDWENVRVEFNCASDSADIFFDNVSLIETDASQFIITKPTPNTTLKAGEETVLEWNNLTVQSITIEFSSDSGEQWETVAEGIANFGERDWSVPQVSSEDCFIRIKCAEADSVLGKSSKFGINSFGKPVEKGELITNGDFSDGMTGWSPLILDNNADAVAEIRAEVMKISIDESGDVPADIILSQNSMPMLEGEDYELSFDCHAAGQRSMRVVLSDSDDPSISIVDTIFELPTSSSTFSWNFVAPRDISAKLEFYLGGSSALVSLDNVSLYTEPDVGIRYSNVARSNKKIVFRAQQFANHVNFILNENATGTIDIYAVNGIRIRSLKASERTVWDRTNSAGAAVAGGSYIAVLRSGNGNLTKKFFLR